MIKKGIKLTVIALLALALTACGGSKKSETYDLKVWGSQEDQALLEELTKKFAESDKGNTYNFTFGVVGEPDAKEKVTADLEASADVFAFANDQLRELVGAGALYTLTKNVDGIKKEQMEGAIDAVTLDGKMYGIPFTADNGYFLYYDSKFFSEDDVKSLDTMIAKAEGAGKQIFMDVSNGWYIASFFLGAGNKIEIGADGKQVIDFNNETGIEVGEYIRKFTASKAFLTGDDEIMMSAANDGKVVAAVSGTWKADEFSKAYGEGYAATKLPTFKLGDKDVQMASFGGYKVYGVNKETKHPEAAMALAEFLANEQSQMRRFELRKLGPSNLKAAASDVVKADVALSALAQQGVFAHSQKDVLGAYWTPAEAFGNEMETKNTKPIKELLDEMVKQVTQ